MVDSVKGKTICLFKTNTKEHYSKPTYAKNVYRDGKKSKKSKLKNQKTTSLKM